MADRAGKKFWDSIWQTRAIPTVVDVKEKGLNNHRNLCFHDFYQKYFIFENKQDSPQLIEVGCAGSAWLPYFALQFGFEVTGLDYSELGCLQAKEILSSVGVRGDVVCGDLFNPPERLLKKFDVVVSTGLVEHFDDTTGCISALAALVKSGGMIVTTIPNMVGVLGWLQRIIDKEVYDIHVLIDRERLDASHSSAGLKVLFCDYFMSVNWSVLNFRKYSESRAGKLMLRLASWSSKAVWLVERTTTGFPASRSLSPYIVCVASLK